MDAFLLFVHVVVCVMLVIIVLLQSGKSADLAGAFGGGGSQSSFGPRGTATLLSKITTTLAILFMITSLLLWLRADIKAGGASVVDDDKVQEQKTGGQGPTETLPVTGEQTEPGTDTVPQSQPAPATTPASTGTGSDTGQETNSQTPQNR